ncbi:MAG TPA: sugar phosphate isomerase/epimerase family protein [Candidatus Hydrogenedentes bacterium]|nr:sugar phosphate isomerase/epimerase family protein [Candidatus Hydrogenedentota bacterium]HOL78302.1 sugar phosphate isomerase/epimerase family protein [Candidatus Hydrogenedentota bacterium]HPO85983.1 sugar phosphate isomerase/epimerase family protein [Candidatus Hydrogenedentota bacterium]
MKIGVSSYSFSRLLHEGTMSILEVPAKAKSMGFDAIEFSTLPLPPSETLSTFAPKLRHACEKAGIPVASYTIGADFLNGSDGDLGAEIKKTQEEVRIAEILGAPSMRHDATRGFPVEKRGARSFDAALPRLIEGCRAVTEFAAERGIRTMVENHGFFCQDSDRVEKLVAGVNHPNFGVLIDMGNFLCADEDPARAVGRLIGSAFHVHAKDFHTKPGTASNPGKGWFQTRGGNYLRGAIIGHGDVPIVQCLRIMKAAGYDGVLSIEFEGMEDPITGIALGLENLRRFAQEAGY